MNEHPTKENQAPELIVCLGASAGGLEALEAFFKQLPDDLDCAFVVVQHLSPDFKSLMGEILTRCTSLPIVTLKDGGTLQRNCVHLIPPTKEIRFEGLTARLGERPSKGVPPMIIDHCFQSLASEFGQKAVAIVLSGTGSDGSRGVASIAEADGLVIVQDPLDAKFDGMPRSAINTGAVHLILTPGEMPGIVNRFRHDPDSGRQPLPPLGLSENLSDIQRIQRALKNNFGVDFGRYYKEGTINRRIDRRVKITHKTDLATYRHLVESNKDELEALYKDLLIGVTSFFRDPEAFEQLEKLVFPRFLDDTNRESIRIWIPGCASGEEVYSILILLLEFLRDNEASIPVKIFATDLHRDSLDLASTAIYTNEALHAVRPELISLYFRKVPGGFQVSHKLREMVVFARHNLIEDAPFTRMDLVVCRNLLIYFNQEAQTRVLGLFGYSLVQNGHVFLGTSESIPEKNKNFAQIDGSARIFRKVREIDFVTSFRAVDPGSPKPGAAVQHNPIIRSKNPSERILDSLLGCFVPSGFLVNRENQLVYTVGNVSRFLRLSPGRMTDDFLQMVPEKLRLHFTGAIRRSFSEQKAIDYGIITLDESVENGKTERFHLRALPVEDYSHNLQHTFLSLTRPQEETPAQESQTRAPSLELPELAARRIEELENELALSREGHQTVVEELESSNEELQSTNEELIASNEELQSTNEELQSVNEELYTVNAEFDSKNRELSILSSDLENFLQSTQIGTIFLDSSYNIRRFTEAAGHAMHLRDGDEGRPILHVTSPLGLNANDLLTILKLVEDSGQPEEREIEGPNGACFLLRVLPFSESTSESPGFVLTFVDVSPVKESERERERLAANLQNLIESVDGILLTLGKDGEVTKPSQSWQSYTGQLWHDYKKHGWLDKIENAPRPEDIFTPDVISRRRFQHQFSLWSDETKSFRHCLARFSALPADEGWAGLIVDLENETETRRILEQKQAVLDEVTDQTSTCIFLKDLDGTYMSLNRFARELMNITKEQVDAGISDFDLFPENEAQKIREDDLKIIESKERAHFEETVGVPGGKVRIFSTTKIPLIDQNGNAYGLAGVSTDVTGHRESERIKAQKSELERVNAELEDKNEQLDTFATVASHDLKQPLRIITNYSDILLEEEASKFDSQTVIYMQRISDAARRLNNLLESIFEYSRSSRESLKRSEIDTNAILDEVLEAHHTSIKEGKVQVIAESLHPLTADRNMFYQILLNLVGNSLKFRSTTHPTLHVYSRQLEGGRIVFGVSDNGIGIADKHFPRVFEPFERLHSREDYEGSGIGLSVAKTVAVRHGGDIKIASRQGEGTTVEFALQPGTDWETQHPPS
ncbi:MAG: chemotaxis protein CheB [Verrucomicrobiota bacterium JB023]|nr:chemotaxis protein CheB [Verrucomicrobiota bacterium JB023]